MPKKWATLSSGTAGVDLHLDLDSGLGRRAALERALRDAIRSGRLAPHTRLPATRALAAELSLARGTVSAAYDQLIAEGYLTARTGSGTVVAEVPPAAAPPGRPAPVPPTVRYDLRPGAPDVTTFPTTAWLGATRRALAAAPATAYGYSDPQGRIELRVALAEYLGRARGVLAAPEQVVITSGYVHALALLAEVIGASTGRRRAVVAMEDPGLDFHRDVVRGRGVEVAPLPVDSRGARTDLLNAGVDAAVVTPAHQYPTGVTLHPDRRHAATEWARATGGLVIEDDYDGEFRYDRQPVGALQGTAADHVAYLGTASKTLAPALRLAWMVLPERLIGPVLRLRGTTGMHTEAIGQLALAEMIASHAYDRHVRACRLRYRRRRDLLVERLAPESRLGLQLRGIAAGLHVMVSLPPSGPSEADVLRHAAAQGLALGELSSHWHAPGAHPQALIVGYGAPREAAYPAAVDTLARVLRTV